MNCEPYTLLSSKQQTEFIGKLVIAVQSDKFCFLDAQRIIRNADVAGIYETTNLHEDKNALSDINSPIENFNK